MKKRQNNSARASALQITISVALLSVSAILFASSFRAAPTAQQDGFYPPLPVQTDSQQPGPNPNPNVPDGIPNPLITVMAPITTMDVSVPITTNILVPVNVSLMDTTTTGGNNYVGFQGDLVFDETIATFGTTGPGTGAFVVSGGITASNWNVSANILVGTGPNGRILRVSAFSLDFTPMSGSGLMFNLKMFRVSSNPGDFTTLVWKPTPDNFVFIDDNLNTYTPIEPSGLVTITGPTPVPTATPTVAPPTQPQPQPHLQQQPQPQPHLQQRHQHRHRRRPQLQVRPNPAASQGNSAD